MDIEYMGEGERGEARRRKRGGAGEARSAMTGARLRAHTSVGKGRGMHASVHVYAWHVGGEPYHMAGMASKARRGGAREAELARRAV